MEMTTPGNQTPSQSEDTEVRRRGPRDRLNSREGLSEGARFTVAALVALVFLGLILYAILGWLGLIPIPGITTG